MQLVTLTTSKTGVGGGGGIKGFYLQRQESESRYCRKKRLTCLSRTAPQPCFCKGILGTIPVCRYNYHWGEFGAPWLSQALSSNKCNIPCMLECWKVLLDSGGRREMEQIAGNVSRPSGFLRVVVKSTVELWMFAGYTATCSIPKTVTWIT